MKNEQIMIIFLLITLLCLCLLNCGGGFEEQSPDSQDISNSILGVDSLYQ